MSRTLPSGITRSFLEQVTIPNHGGRYTPISHKSIIDKSLETIVNKGFNIKQELYASNASGTVAMGKILLDYGSDPDLKMMFVWGNSYDKSTRFKCGIGAYIERTNSYIFAGHLSNFARKHTGNADQLAVEMIETQLNQANMFYNYLCNGKNQMIAKELTVKEMSEITGRLFIEEQVLNKEQVSMVRDHIVNEVALFEEYSKNNLWNFYNSIGYALKHSHPKTWFEDQSKAYSHILNNVINQPSVAVNITPSETEEQAPDNQMNIFDVIDEAEPVTNSDEILSIFDDNSPLELPEL
jgi:hypothetical protein